jgi:hypothetical protein
MRKSLKVPAAVGAAAFLMGLVLAAGSREQATPSTGYIPKDRVVELAKAADASLASFTPSRSAVEYFAALVDPVHLRVFLCPSRPADLRIAASVGLAVDPALHPALTVEFIAVADDLSEPAALVAENEVEKAPEIIVYWLGEEVARLHPAAGAVVEEDLAASIHTARTQIAEEMILDNEFFRNVFHKDLLALDCKRCHGPR